MTDTENELPTVVLLHGLRRTQRAMQRLGRFLESAGYSTWSCSYRGQKQSIEASAESVAQRIDAALGGRPLLAVGHSLGGIIIRLLAERFDWRGVVMLAPPNNGSRLAKALRNNPFYRKLYGPAGQQLANGNGWPQPPQPFAVVAGTRPAPRLSLSHLAGRAYRAFEPGCVHDGKITLEETQLEGMADFATVDVHHTWLMNHPDVQQWIVNFFKTGSFGANPCQ